MAIVSCPKCDKNISSHTNLCPYCGFQRGEVAEEQLLEFRRRKLRDHIYHLKMTSYATLAMIIGAFGWYLVDTSNFQRMSSPGGVVQCRRTGLPRDTCLSAQSQVGLEKARSMRTGTAARCGSCPDLLNPLD